MWRQSFSLCAGVMGCGAAEATGLGFICFVVINPRVLSANIVDFGPFFLFHKLSNLTPPPSRAQGRELPDFKAPISAQNADAIMSFVAQTLGIMVGSLEVLLGLRV